MRLKIGLWGPHVLHGLLGSRFRYCKEDAALGDSQRVRIRFQNLYLFRSEAISFCHRCQQSFLISLYHLRSYLSHRFCRLSALLCCFHCPPLRIGQNSLSILRDWCYIDCPFPGIDAKFICPLYGEYFKALFPLWVRYQLKVHPEGCKIGPFGCIVYLYQFASQWGIAPYHHVEPCAGRKPFHFGELHLGTEKAFPGRQGHGAIQKVPRI